MRQNLPPPWTLGSKDIDEIPMLVVHMSKGELEGLDNLQGGPSIDSDTGIREYSKLGPIINDPEIREIFFDISNQLKTQGKISPPMKEAYTVAKDYSLPYRETEEEEHDHFIRSLEKTGRGSDSKLAYIPMSLAELLVEIEHVPSINPKTELLEFGFFDELLKVVGTIGGAILGGPIGGGIFRSVMGMITGQKPKDAIISGLKTGALTYGAQGLGQAAGLTGSTPYTAGFFGGTPNALATGLGSMGIGKAAAASAGTQTLPVAQQVVNSAFSQPPSPGLLGTIGNMASSLAPYAPLGVGALSYMGSKQHHKHLQKEKEKQESKWNEEKHRMGWDIDWTPVKKEYEKNPEYWNLTNEDLERGITEPYYVEKGQKYATGGLVQSYKKGTLVRGKGKGQDDLIKTSVPDGTYISDASTNSMLGDGSSEAGAKVWNDLEQKVKRKIPKNILLNVEKSIKKNSHQVPVWLSDSEYKIDPVTVACLPYALGENKISNERGANILRTAIKKIRKHKAQAGSGLPPKAKPLLEYIRMI